MKSLSRFFVASLPILSLLLMGAGPGIHVRESNALLQQLVSSDEVWAERSQLDKADIYLHLGAISPDLDWASDELTFGHSRTLFYFLLDKALEEQNDLHILFAVGGIAHQATDAFWESFFTPTLIASAPLGMWDLYGDVGNNRGEAETITEGFGDLVLGEWHPIVDILFSLWLDSDEAKAEAMDLIGWYCEGGKEYFGDDTNCEIVKAELAEKLTMAEDYVGFMTLEQAHTMVDILIDQPLPDLADTAAGGSLTSFLGDVGSISQWAVVDLERFKASPLCDPEFWALYDQMNHLGPTWAFRYVTQRLTKSFPGWEPNGMASGNIRSIMAFLPDDYTVHPDLTLRSLRWTDGNAAPIDSVAPDAPSFQATAVVELYVAQDFHHSVRGVVRKDMPGLDSEPGPSLGEASVQIDQDPLNYTVDEPTLLTIPFQTDSAEAVGFYVDIYVDDAPGPTYTTNWDRLWLIDELDMDRPIYTQNFGSYGFWPPSLPITPLPDSNNPASLLVKVRQKPFGPGLEAASVTLTPLDAPDSFDTTTDANGVAVFDGIYPATQNTLHVVVDQNLYGAVSDIDVVLTGGQTQWVTVEADRKVAFLDVPAWFDPTKKLEFSFDADAYLDQTDHFEVRGLDATNQPLTLTYSFTIGDVAVQDWPALPDGSAVYLEVLPVYTTLEPGLAGLSDPILVDSTPPTLTTHSMEVVDLTPCLPNDGSVALPFFPETIVVARAVEPHSPLVASVLCDGAALDLEITLLADEQEPGAYLVSLLLPARTCTDSDGTSGKLELAVTNGSGHVVKLQITDRPSWDESRLCPPDPVESEPDVIEEVLADIVKPDLTPDQSEPQSDVEPQGDVAPDQTADTTPVQPAPTKKSGGCSTQSEPSLPALGLLLLAAASLLFLRRRSFRRVSAL